MNVEIVLRYFRYTKAEIDEMSDLDAFRRYYVASKLMEAMSGMGGGGGGGQYGSYTPDRLPSKERRRSSQATQSTDSYSFPSG
ncbi:hypothetical protein [uncultured virus]|uniref:Uncharacterized protein n=1 Tax=uncultured virus TaxID=340016 RepID=A0A218MKY8_9VIRU|nr:hypothetical protein [uncultured virus]